MSRFIAMFKAFAAADSYTYISFPSSGILRNISAKLYSTADDEFSVQFGNVSNLNTTTVPPADQTMVTVKGKQSKDYWRIDSMDFESPDTQLRGQYFIHRKDPMFIRKDAKYQIGINRNSTNTVMIVVIMGEFVPYQNADYEIQYLFDGAESVSGNFAKLICIPDNLRDVWIEYLAVCGETTVHESGIIHLKIQRSQDVPLPLSNMTGEGLIDGNKSILGDVIYGGQEFDILVNSLVSGLAQTKGSFVVKDIIKSGDGFAFDMTQIIGTLADVTLKVNVHGKAFRTGRTKYKTEFMDGNLLEQPIGVGGN